MRRIILSKKIMILGASILQLPAIIKAKELGYYVISVDFDADAIGFKYSDVKCIISTVDENKVLELVKKYKPDGIMTLSSDQPVKTIAYINNKLGIKNCLSYDDALCATNKDLMRQRFLEKKVPVPKFEIARSKDSYYKKVSEFEFPVIIKAADNSGSRGISLVNSKEDIKFAYEHSLLNSPKRIVLIEEYMKGPEVSVELFAKDGKTTLIAITDKITTGAPNFVELGHSIPSNLSNKEKIEIEKVAISASKAIGIKNGPAHVEIIMTQNGAKIVEIGARLGGDSITSYLVPMAKKFDMVEATIKNVLNEQYEIKTSDIGGSAIRFITSLSFGVIKSIQGVDLASEIDGVKLINFNKKIGDTVQVVKSSSDRIGYIIAKGNTSTEAIDACNKDLSKIVIEII